MYKNNIVVPINNGIHTRIAAMIVHKATEIKNKYGLDLYIKRMDSREPLAISMLALISLKIKKHEIIEISCNSTSSKAESAVLELCDFINYDISKENPTSKLDDIIEENTIAYDQIFTNIPIGILVIDKNSKITMANDYSLKIIGYSLKDILGKNIKDIIPSSELPDIIKNKCYHKGKTQYMDNRILITNRSPIYFNDKILGAISVFQDISELVGIKELNEKFKKILEASHDLICFVDENGKIIYVNPSYKKHFSINSKDIIGKDIKESSPNSLIMEVFNTKKPKENVIYNKDNINIISTIEPIFIDNEFKGVISISKTVDELKDLTLKLTESEEKLMYYKNELTRHLPLSSSFKSIIGWNSSLKDCLSIAEKASKSTSTVLVRGESGTGKEIIANAIHDNSSRKNKPFVRVNCAAIPENLLESELFGFEKGAFTGAIKKKPGKFNIADGGTIFLDEIGDLPISMQVKLLRVLQEKEFESVGGIKTQKVDVRIIAATNRNLEDMIKDNTFREDLYYRLNVLNISLPPLRHRKQDINLLVEHFINKINPKLNKNIAGINKGALLKLQQYDWPGNIRELENIVERAMNMCDKSIITAKDLPFYISNNSFDDSYNFTINEDNLKTLEEYEKEIITLAMKKYKSFNKAGKALGITHRTVSLKCKKYNINPEIYK
ncbi:sigma 54-interacting transcriptional regulator [Clostridium sporogenes]|uniref:sigma 54-interacting transcriptional regulator n=1 Tax=Clostridium sporogenes TaxID=1509 RepID=UPI001C1281D9|nr:sigma 54-interacting transcriptional regulator [Clostridium sporogenes]MBU5301259.1 sigma 54-interacting transcriptional regulator [Clostridium sporogenes]